MANKVYATKTVIDSNTFNVLKDTILVYDMEFNERITRSGIILPDDDMKSAGIRPRWGKVYKVGKDIDFISPGQHILVAHGRWTRGQAIEDENGEKIIRKVDPKDVLMVSDTPIEDETLSGKA